MKNYLIFLFVCLAILGCTTPAPQPAPADNTDTSSHLCETDEHPDFCYIRAAVQEQDTSFCLEIAEPFFKDTCYNQVAAWYNQPELCPNVEDTFSREFCYFGLAIQLSDTSLCSSITGEAPNAPIPITEEMCLSVASVQNTKENIRNESLLTDENILNLVYITSEEVDEAFVAALQSVS